MTTTITLFRCPKCGSGKVEPYRDGKKLRFPIISALKNRRIDSFHCPDCSAVSDHCMNPAHKTIADSIVVLAQENKRTEEYLSKYPNIEVCPVGHALYMGKSE